MPLLNVVDDDYEVERKNGRIRLKARLKKGFFDISSSATHTGHEAVIERLTAETVGDVSPAKCGTKIVSNSEGRDAERRVLCALNS